ncbi:hypothetical protein [Ferrovibrio terrae]|uniref:hypothetical protein n=1 Tax=Ferrovibrio terrae TaxID=2594003 RepID=UPI0031381CC2
MTRFIKHARHGAVLALLLIIAACAPFSLVPASTNDVANFRVDADIAWNKVNQLRLESSAPLAYWTVDGPSLNGMLFIGGVKDGQPVVKVQGDTTKDNALIFRNGMTATEIVELWEATTAKISQTTIAKGSNIEGATFGGTSGFKFDFHYVTKDEVDRSGIGYATVKDGRLYLIFFSGTKLHHYPARLASAKRIIESARITG